VNRGFDFTVPVLALGAALSSQAAVAQEVRGPEAVGTAPATSVPLPAPATAQPAPVNNAASADQSLGEIVVTARRTSENLQSVPISITAFSGAQLQQQNARTLSDVAILTPGLQMNYSTATSAGLIVTIRGQAVQDPLANQDPSVGVYVDGLYWARAYGANADLLDIRGVQVLKGPQGTLFGRNTTGGAILLNTNDPNFALSGLVSATYGRFDYRTVTGVLNVPLIDDKLAVRVAGQLIKRDGYIHDNNNGVTLGNLDSYTVRSKLLFKPTQNLSIIVSGEWYRSKTLNVPQRLIYASPTSRSAISTVVEVDGSATAAALGCFNPGVGPACQARASALFNDSIAKNQADNADLTTIPRSYVKTQTYGATATLDTPFGAINAIGGYRKVRSLSFNDNDGSRFSLLDNGPGPGLALPGNTNDDANLSQYSMELVATGKAFDNRLDFAAGLYYFHESGNDGSASMSLAAISPVARVFYGNIKNDSKSIFGQGTYHITDALSLTGGLRYSIDDKRLISYNHSFPLPGPPTPANTTCIVAAVCPASRHDSFNGVSYTASIDYRIADGILAYVKTAKGYRAGGENLRMTNPAGFIPFKPENAFSYEGGVKSEFLDRRLRVNVAGYYTILKDIQRTIQVVSASGVPAQAITNAGQADFYGGEFEASAALPGGFRLDGTVGYTHPKYVEFIDNGFDRSRDIFYGVPKWTASIYPSWTHDFDIGKLLLRADFSYQSDMNISPVAFYTDDAGVLRDAQNGRPVSTVDAAGYLRGATDQAHWLVNARASITVMDDRLELAVWGRNLTDKRDYVAGLTVPGLGFSSASEREPRTFGVTATMKFEAH